MPVQHSVFNDYPDVRLIGNLAVLPLRTKYRGPAFQTTEYDIIDEVVDLFRVNSFFRNFEIKGPADRTLVYGILFVNECLTQLRQNPTFQQAQKTLNVLASDDFAIPGEPGFPLNSIYAAPATVHELDTLRQYLSQFRQELAERLLQHVYQLDASVPSKHWMLFSRKRFMGLSLAAR